MLSCFSWPGFCDVWFAQLVCCDHASLLPVCFPLYLLCCDYCPWNEERQLHRGRHVRISLTVQAAETDGSNGGRSGGRVR